MNFPSWWATTTIGDSLKLIRGISFPKDSKRFEPMDGHIACLRTTNVQRDVEWGDLWYIPEQYVKRDEQFIKPLDILISTANSLELVGKVAQVNNLPTKSTLGAFISLIRVPDTINPKYIYYLLSSSEIQNQIHNLASTTTNISNISTGKLATVVIQIAPLPEQERIVARIESLFSRLDAGVTALKHAQAALKRYRASVLKAACEGRLVPQDPNDEPAEELLKRICGGKGSAIDPEGLPDLPVGWCWAKMEQLGKHRLGKMLDKEKNIGTLRPYLRNANVRWFGFDLNDVFEIKVTDEELDNIVAQNGDLIVCEGGEPGRAAVWESEEKIVIQKALHRLRPYQGISPKYLVYKLASDANAGILEEYFTGSTIKHFTGESFRSYQLPLPPTQEQNRIVEEIERQFIFVQQLESTVSASLARAARLRQSILKQAFEGRM